MVNLRKFLNKIKMKITIDVREKTNPILGGLRLDKIHDKNFTIISNNCWGGHVYRYFNMNYLSPTVGLYFYTDEYIRFIQNLSQYINTNLIFIDYRDSKYKADLLRTGNINVPIGLLGDIEIVFLHYKTQEEAYEKWNRRLERINFNNIVYKMSEQNLCTTEAMKKFDKIPEPRKFVLTSNNYNIKSQVIMKEYLGLGSTPDDTTYFNRYVDVIRFLNGLSFKRNQI